MYLYVLGSGPAVMGTKNPASEADIHTARSRDLHARNFGVDARSSNELKTLQRLHGGHYALGGYMGCIYKDERVTLNHCIPRMTNMQHRKDFDHGYVFLSK